MDRGQPSIESADRLVDGEIEFTFDHDLAGRGQAVEPSSRRCSDREPLDRQRVPYCVRVDADLGRCSDERIGLHSGPVLGWPRRFETMSARQDPIHRVAIQPLVHTSTLRVPDRPRHHALKRHRAAGV